MVRYTKSNIEGLCRNVNVELAKCGKYRLVIGYRYNYKAIDVIRIDEHKKHGGIERTLIASLTKNEIWQWLHAFLNGIFYSHDGQYPTQRKV